MAPWRFLTSRLGSSTAPQAKRTRWPRLVPALLLAVALGAAEDPPAPDEALLERTLPQRTALHQDATLAGPFEQLVAAWKQAGQLPQLVAVYTDHCAGWPEDANAAIVHLRLLLAAADQGTVREARETVRRFPDHPFVRWLAWRALDEARDPGALAELEKAVALETLAWRRTQWSGELVKAALAAGKREVAERHLRERIEGEMRADRVAAVAAQMADAGFHQAALAAYDTAALREPGTETVVEIELGRAAAEAALGRRADAARRLDALAERIGPDHWRRAEVARRRLGVAADAAEREGLLAQVRARLASGEADEAQVLDGARMLAESGAGDEALAALRAAEARLGSTPRLEREIDAAYDRRRDEAGRAAWLAERAAADPGRADLVWRRAVALALSGRGSESDALVEAALAPLDAAARGEALAGLARQLRRASGTGAASEVFRRALEAAPGRLDLRRELGECLVALSRARELRALFSGDAALAAAKDAPAELLLDAVPFLEKQGLSAEADALVAARLAADPGHFELRLVAARLARRLGDEPRSRRHLGDARALADTAARYRAWLDVLLPSDGKPDALAVLVGEEGERVLRETRLADRLAPLADAARGVGQAEAARTLLAGVLAGAVPAAAELPLRRALVECLAGLPERQQELTEQLRLLGELDAEARDEIMLRLALAQEGAPGAELAEVDLRQVRDAALLDSLLARAREQGDGERAREAAGRLVEVDPSDAARWRAFLAQLACSGDERAFRSTVRRLIAGVDRAKPPADVRALLTRQLGDSAWRQALRALADGGGDGLRDALEALAELEAGEPDPAERAWIPWARARLAQRLGDAVQAREALAAFLRGAVSSGQDLVLPDGLTLAAGEAERLLVDPTPPAPNPLPPGPFEAQWVVRATDPIGGLAAAAGHLVVAERGGRLSGWTLAGGRRRWSVDGLCDGGAVPWVNDNQVVVPGRPALLCAAGALVAAANGTEVSGVDAATGAVRWRATFAAPVAALGQHQGEVVVVTADDAVVAGLDPATGKRRWTFAPELPEDQERPAQAALANGRVLLVGRRTALLDLDARAVAWRIDWKRVRPVDVRLEPATAAPVATQDNANAAFLPQRRYGRYRHHRNTMPASTISQTAAAVAPVVPAGAPPAGDDVRLVTPLALPLARAQMIEGLQFSGDTACLATDEGNLLLPLTVPGLAAPLSGGQDWGFLPLGIHGGRAVLHDGSRVLLRGADGSGTIIGVGAALAAADAPAAAADAAEGLYEGAGGLGMALSGDVLWAVGRDGLAGFRLPDGERLFLQPFPDHVRAAIQEARIDQWLPPQLAWTTAAGVVAVTVGERTVVGLRALRPAEDGDAIP